MHLPITRRDLYSACEAATLARARRDARGFLRFLAQRDLHGRLLTGWHTLRDELAALAALVPTSVLAGDPPR